MSAGPPAAVAQSRAPGAPPAGTAQLVGRAGRALLDTYGPPAAAFVAGTGCTLVDADGRRYTDLFGGIAVSALGHAHPAVVAAVSRQVATLAHTSNLYVSEPTVRLAERLVELSGGERVFLCNSGTEAVEAALKVVRAHWRGERVKVVAAEGGFHGRTLGALSVTGQPAKRAPFEPLPGPVEFVPFGDVAALAAAVDERTAAVLLEPVQGENGVVVPDPGYLAAAAGVAAAAGALFVVDEVQTGIGRTGSWFAHQQAGVRPDVLTLAKGLGGGLPIGAAVVRGPAVGALRPGDHGSTFGGNPVCAAAALAVLDTIEADGLLERARLAGERLGAGLAAVEHPLVAGERGLGLLRGLVLTRPVAAAVEAAARAAGFVVGTATAGVVRLAPPLVVGDAEVDAFLAVLPAVLAEVASVGT